MINPTLNRVDLEEAYVALVREADKLRKEADLLHARCIGTVYVLYSYGWPIPEVEGLSIPWLKK